MPEHPGISAIVTAYKLRESLFTTLRTLQDCRPPPDEILVHVDANQTACRDAVAARFPGVRILLSADHVGPGGGRNKLLAAAKNDYVASFDDDSRPMDADFFDRARQVIQGHPEAAMIATEIFLRDQPEREAEPSLALVADFVGCGCIYRRDVFLRTSGYVPLPIAYAMEEVDLAIRLHASGWRILQSRALRIIHDTDDSHHRDSEVTLAIIANLGLFAFLRYPVWFWWLGALQIVNRILWLFTHGRRIGILAGLKRIPTHAWRHRAHRAVVPGRKLISYLWLRRHPVAVAGSP